MSKAASKMGSSSLRVTKTVRSASRKSVSEPRSTWLRARVASFRRPGPASSPASWRSRAKPASRGSRSGRTSLTVKGLPRFGSGYEGRDGLPRPGEVLLVLERGAQRRLDQRGVDALGAQRRQRAGPVERLRHSRQLVEVHLAEPADEQRHLAGEPGGRLGDAGLDDGDLLFEVGVVDPVVEAAPLQRVMDLAGAVGGDDDEGRPLGGDRAELGDRDLEIAQQLEQEGLELLVGAVDLVDQSEERRVGKECRSRW